MTACITCGMPFEGDHVNDVGLETSEGPICIYDVQDGNIKNPEEIFEGGVQFFLRDAVPGNRDLAERLTRKNMRSLVYWQTHPFAELSGAVATDQEFGEALAKL